jgi:hypothetical protein
VSAWSGLVQCDECHATIAGDTQEDAIEKWNRRVVTPAQVEAAVDALCENDYDCARMSRFDLIQYLMRAAWFEVQE